MNTPKSLLERISPAKASVSQGKFPYNAEEINEYNGTAVHQNLYGSIASKFSSATTSLQHLPPVSSTEPGNKKRKRRTADDGESEREKMSMKLREDSEDYLAPWFPGTSVNGHLPLSASYADRLHAEIIALTSYLTPTLQERRARSLLVSYITNMVRERWPARYGRDDGAIVHTFGSVATGLELPGGDIDLVLEFPSNTELTTRDRKTILFQLAGILRSPERSSVVRDVHVVARARVPIVKIQTVDELGGFSIDISIKQSSTETRCSSSSSSAPVGQTLDPALASIPVIRSLLSLQPALRHLVLFVKLFLSTYVDQDSGKSGLGSAATGGIGSYVLICMCIGYLAHAGILDVENSLKVDAAEREVATHTDTETPSPSVPNLGALLKGFLKYYGQDFDYTTNYVCAVKEGFASRRRTEEDGRETVWGEKQEKDPVNPIDRPKPVQEKLGVACLIDSDKDVARGCSRLSEIRAAFIEALQIMENTENAAGTAEQDSIIGKVVRIPKDTINQRARVARAIDSGKYENTTNRQPNRMGFSGYGNDWRQRGRDAPLDDGRWRRDAYQPRHHWQNTAGHRDSRAYRR